MSELKDQVRIRKFLSSDEGFIFSTWLRTYRHSSPFAKPIANKTFYSRHHVIVERILKREGAKILVACLEDEPNTILGYIVAEYFEGRPVIHWIYVKDAFRKMGIAQLLIEAAHLVPNEALYTHRTYALDWIEEKFPGLTYDPYLI